MACCGKIQFAFACFFTLSTLIRCQESSTAKPVEEEVLVQSETKDGKIEIVKQIKKINQDGSYTIGYEADDGSFKIESRDVLGNIKGTYGFVDEGGKIKRVSYSSSNASDVFGNHEQPLEPPEFPSTRQPSTVTSTATTSAVPSTTPLSVIQSIARRKASSSTTAKPVAYSSATPRVLLQRPSLKTSELKQEGQIGRPDISLKKPIPLNIDEKPVTEQVSLDTRSNILRRQLPQDRSSFDAQDHVYGLQQALGHNDLSDIYNSGGSITNRPLFTTTRSNIGVPIISSTTSTPVLLPKPTANYVSNYQRSQVQEVESSTFSEKPVEEAATSTERASTSTNVPVVQIPANPSEPLYAIRHPQGAILVPLSQIRNRVIPVETMQEVFNAQRTYLRQPEVEIERSAVRRLNPPQLRSFPVQVDRNGFLRQMPTPYPVPVPTTPIPAERENEVDHIQPPVSTRDFQVLLNHLILRQKRLERISALTNPKLYPELYQQPQRYPKVVPVNPPQQQYYVQQPQTGGSTRQYVRVRPQEVEDSRRFYDPYAADRRVARFHKAPNRISSLDENEEYLPPDVREMLLLRMLQLAMNPALPVEDGKEPEQVATAMTPQYHPLPVKNVEILGEEEEENEEKMSRLRLAVARSKRFNDEEMEYME